jgi:hypothetical protein
MTTEAEIDASGDAKKVLAVRYPPAMRGTTRRPLTRRGIIPPPDDAYARQRRGGGPPPPFPGDV